MNFKVKSSEMVILLLVSLMSFTANLPEQVIGGLVDKKLLLLVLVTSVVIALFRYLRLMLFLAMVILALGANIPQDFAESMGFNPMIMLLALGFLLTVSLLNYAFKLLPTGMEENPTTEKSDTRFELLTAIHKGDHGKVYELLNMDAKVNFFEQGFTPLHLAVERGYPDIVRMLVNSGADIEAQNAEGKTPVEVALDRKFIRSSEILFKASQFYAAQSEQVASDDATSQTETQQAV